MLGLAMMAAELAEKRKNRGRRFPAGIHRRDGTLSIASREYARKAASSVPCSAEYYRICDRVTRGERP